ncbi:zinc-dependent alcohol dehydrogenase [Candidatus Nitrospira salsa]|nr:MAG: glutathione-dependent formaldehyde dehydrogenase [Nitrospirales bacterium]
MRAVCWNGIHDVRVENVADPEILNPRDAIVRVSLTAICGSDLHLYDGYIPTMKSGDILGHEFMGEVVEVGSSIKNLSKGDRVVVPFNIACGRCFFCQGKMWSCCDNSNPNAWMAEKAYGHSPAGLFGYSHMLGGYAGGQAEYVRIPFADTGPLKVPAGLKDEDVLFLSDIFPTGYQAADNCQIKEGDTVAVWGCGPVGQFAIRSALLLGAAKVFAIDHHVRRLDLSRQKGNEQHLNDERVETINFDEEEVYDRLMESTGGRGPDSCIDAVGLETHGTTLDALYDRIKVASMLATDRIHVIRQAARAVRKNGIISIPGVYGGFADKFPIGAIFGKGVTIRCGQTHVHNYLNPLLKRIEKEEIDPSFIISHRYSLDEAPEAYKAFRYNQNDCIKVVLLP